MKVLVLSNNELTKREIGNELEDLQEIVGGYIEIPFLSEALYEKGIDIIINEEGKLIDGMRPEIAIVSNRDGRTLDIVFGNCIFASHDDEGNTVGLNDEQIAVVTEKLKTTAMLRKAKEEVRVLFI